MPTTTTAAADCGARFGVTPPRQAWVMTFATFASITAVADDQHGVVLHRQARALGVSDWQWTSYHTHHLLERIDLSCSRVVGAPVTHNQRIHAATLSSGGIASHRTAARLHGLGRSEVIEVLVPQNRYYRTGSAIAHRSLDLTAADQTVLDGIPLTTATRTLLDVGAVVGPATLEIMVDQALNRRLTTIDALVRRFLQVARRGRRGVGRLRPILDARDPLLVATESPLETLVVRILRANCLPEPQRQIEIVVDGRRYRIDLGYEDLRIAIEIDGRVHNEGQRFDTDRIRQNALVLAGWLVLRFTHPVITSYPATVADRVRAAIALRVAEVA